MATRKGAISIEIKGLRDLGLVPGRIDQATRQLRRDVADGLADKVRDNIRSRSGDLAASWRGTVDRFGKVRVTSRGVKYAKASVRGAYITPRRRRALKFADGRVRRWARINSGAWVGQPDDRRANYVQRAFGHFHEIVRDGFRQNFTRLTASSLRSAGFGGGGGSGGLSAIARQVWDEVDD